MMMKSILAALGVACLSAVTLGQDPEEPKVPALPEKELIDTLQKDQSGPPPKSPRPSKPLAVNDRLVLKDGAVFLKLPGSEILIPMSGGGASGCFGEPAAKLETPKPR